MCIRDSNKGIVDGDANSDLLYYTDISEAVANYDSSYFETTTEKVFLLDVKQANACLLYTSRCV